MNRAAMGGHKKVVELLLANGADINANAKYGCSPLFSAANKEVAELLLTRGADIKAKYHEGRTWLHAAVNWHHKDVVELALAKGLDVNDADNWQGETPLHLVREKDVAELLLVNGAAVNAKDRGGNTPLHESARYNYREVAALLLSRGADVNATNKDGLTPIQLAEKNNQKDIVELLRQPSIKAVREALDDGLVAAGQQQWTVAIRHFLKAQAATPTAPEVLFNLGLAESKVSGRELRAMAWFQAYLLAAPAAANAATVRKEIANLKVRVEGTLEKLVGQAKQLAGQLSGDDYDRARAFCDVAIAQARTGDPYGAEQTLHKVGVSDLTKAKQRTHYSNHYKNSFDFEPEKPLPATTKDRLEALIQLVNKDMKEELFTDLQSALQTIAAKPDSKGILNGMLKAIEQLGDCFNDVKRLSP